MREERYESLVDTLNILLSQVSPTTGGGRGNTQPSLFINTDLNLDTLTMNQILLAHVLLHRFYVVGNKKLSKQNIRNLHREIRTKMEHSDFDKLDRDDKNEQQN